MPSAISKRIAAIEADVGVPLLQRGRRGIAPTPAGEVLLLQARDVLDTLERMRTELSEFASGAHGERARVREPVGAVGIPAGRHRQASWPAITRCG